MVSYQTCPHPYPSCQLWVLFVYSDASLSASQVSGLCSRFIRPDLLNMFRPEYQQSHDRNQAL